MTLIELKNASFGYGDNIVIKSINLTVNDGDFICIVGPNGSGKTTLISGILGLIKPINGSVKYKELDQNAIGFMPQETRIDPNFPASVYEIVLSGSLGTNKTKGLFYSKEAKCAANEKLKILHIDHLRDKKFADLSGGQRQRVLIARALLATKKLLILDEPSNNLDSTTKDNLYKIITELNQKYGIAIIMITHDLDHGNLIGNKVLSLRDRDYFYGSAKEFIRKVHHE